MADYFLPGDFLRSSRVITLSDAGGVSWTWTPATNTLTAGAVDAETLDGFDSTEFALLAQDEIVTAIDCAERCGSTISNARALTMARKYLANKQAA